MDLLDHTAPGINKTFMPYDWPGLVEEMSGHLTSFFERGHIKCAASDLFSRRDLDEHAPPPGYFMIHQIVMGSQEKFGYNNNGDSWPEDGLEKYHPTFVTHGHKYREHRNRDPKKAIGSIKAAKFSKRMGRVETLEHIEIAKAEKEYEMAKAGKDLHASMAARVPFDRCSICSHEAKYASLYCDDLKNRMMQYIPSAKKYANAINPIATFFDSSIVENPAAREAKHLEYRFGPDLMKAASAKPVLSGAQWAEFEGVDTTQRLLLDSNSTNLLKKLAALEGSEQPDPYRDHVSKQAFVHEHNIKEHEWNVMQRLMPGTFFNKLARRRILLPFDMFASYATGKSPTEVRNDPLFSKTASMLPGVFRALATALEQGGCGCGQQDMDLFSSDRSSAAAFDPANSDEIDSIMDKATDQWSGEVEPVRKRSVMIITIKKARTAQPIMQPPAVQDMPPLLMLYGLYKMAAVRDAVHFAKDDHRDVEHEMLRCCVDQNSINFTFDS